MSLQLTGKLISGTATEKKTDTFSVRTFVLELTETGANGMVFTNLAQFQLVNAQCAILDQFQPGQMVTVNFNVRGQAWNDKVITNLNAWKIEHAQQVAAQPAPQHMAPAHQPQQGFGAPQPQTTWQPPKPAPQQWGAQTSPTEKAPF